MNHEFPSCHWAGVRRRLLFRLEAPSSRVHEPAWLSGKGLGWEDCQGHIGPCTGPGLATSPGQAPERRVPRAEGGMPPAHPHPTAAGSEAQSRGQAPGLRAP